MASKTSLRGAKRRGNLVKLPEIATLLAVARKALLRGPVKPTVSPRGLTTGSIKTIKNTNNLVFLTGSRGQATG
ncbi:tRNA(Ile)-lysidine synthase domain protein [Rickettsia hoogstraalii str. RCCE3]|nr:tRNA(Ile)-lysidine synthase domain protein [Rickettsia hoogstraalii str. RCCE3]